MVLHAQHGDRVGSAANEVLLPRLPAIAEDARPRIVGRQLRGVFAHAGHADVVR